MSKIHAISQEILVIHIVPAGSTQENNTLSGCLFPKSDEGGAISYVKSISITTTSSPVEVTPYGKGPCCMTIFAIGGGSGGGFNGGGSGHVATKELNSQIGPC